MQLQLLLPDAAVLALRTLPVLVAGVCGHVSVQVGLAGGAVLAVHAGEWLRDLWALHTPVHALHVFLHVRQQLEPFPTNRARMCFVRGLSDRVNAYVVAQLHSETQQSEARPALLLPWDED